MNTEYQRQFTIRNWVDLLKTRGYPQITIITAGEVATVNYEDIYATLRNEESEHFDLIKSVIDIPFVNMWNNNKTKTTTISFVRDVDDLNEICFVNC